MRKIWDEEAWTDYLYWQAEDKKTFRNSSMQRTLQINAQ